MALNHNSKTSPNEPDWAKVDKTKLPRNAFADEGSSENKSTWSYPHHWVANGELGDEGVYVDGDMYLHRGGLNAAWAAANGARSGQKASQSVIDHLQNHRKDIGVNKTSQGENSMEKLTKEEFAAAFPDLHKEIAEEAYSKGFSDGLEKGKLEGAASGAEAERLRIQGVESLFMAGHEDLIREMKYDGKTTKEEAAVRLIAAENEIRKTKLETFRSEHQTVVNQVDPEAGGKSEKDADENLPLEERAKKKWDSDADIRKEFALGGFASFVAWLKNEKNVRFLKNKRDE